MTILEHSVPLPLLVLATLAGLALAGFSAWRHLQHSSRKHLLITALHGLTLLALAWCLLLPGRKDTVSHLLKPRFLIALDTSRSMAQPPPTGGDDRWTRAQDILELPWVRAVGAECEIEVFPLDSGIGKSQALDELDDLSPEGSVSLLRDGLRAIGDRFAGVNVVGALLLSDGIDTREALDDWATGERPFPIHTVRLEPEGEWLKEPDLRVDSVTTTRRVTVGWKTELRVKVSGQGTRSAAIAVQVFKNGELLEEKPTQIPDAGGEREIVFELENPEVGMFNYRVHLPPLPEEANTDDNEYVTSVQVIDARNRLLYVEGVPRWDYKYMRRVLLAHQKISPVIFFSGPDGKPRMGSQVGSMTADMTPSELGFFKVVMLGNLDAEELGTQRAQNLLSFVENGGSLVLLGGRKSWTEGGFSETGLSRISPVRGNLEALDGGDKPFPVRLGDSARGHPAFAGDDSFWEIIPPVLSVFAGAELTPGAQTLVTAETSKGPQPIVAVQRYGQGKVIAVLTDSLWRWQLGPEASKNQPFQRFWTQIISWLLPEESELDSDPVELFAAYDQAYLGEEFEIVARVGGDSPPGDGVTCVVTDPEGREIPFQMTAREVSTSSGTAFPGFVLPYAPGAAGVHHAVATAQIDGRKETSKPLTFFVRPFSPETLPRPINTNVLESLASASGGGFFESAEELDTALSRLELQVAEEETSRFRSLWQNWPSIGVLLGLLAVTWFLRKSQNMP